jgi:Fe2+ transport system protein FeoA
MKHVEVGEGYFALSREERRALLRRLLNGMSPNAEVRVLAASPTGPEESDSQQMGSDDDETD